MPTALAKSSERAPAAHDELLQPPVLIVDDDQEMCELAETGLARRGLSVSWCLSAPEALTRMDAEDFSVLVVDIHMEGMNGLELCHEAMGKRPDLAVIVMTGFGSMDHAVSAMRAGAYDFITKPVSLDALAMAH